MTNTDSQLSAEISAPSSTPSLPPSSAERWQLWRQRGLIGLSLTGLGVLGIGLEDFSPRDAAWFWIVVLPLFAVVSMQLSTRKARARGDKVWPVIRAEIYHWGGFLIALKIMLLFIQQGTLDREAGGMVSLLLLALACYYAGVHFDPIFLLVSGPLALAAVLASYITQYMWFVLATLGLLIVVLLVVHLRATQRMKAVSDAGETPESLPPPQKLTSGD